MKKITILFLVLICIPTVSGWTSDNDLRFSPNKITGGAVVTCLAGFHIGENKISKNPTQDMRGLLTSLSIEFPASKSSMFLMSIDYDRISFVPDIKDGYRWKITQSTITVIGGFRFFIEGN